jgi:hypothetical protein
VVPEQECRLAFGDVERLICGRVEMQGRAGLAGGNRQDFRDIGFAHLGWAKAKVSRAIAGRDNSATVDRLHVEPQPTSWTCPGRPSCALSSDASFWFLALVYAVVDDALSSDFTLGVDLEVFIAEYVIV